MRRLLEKAEITIGGDAPQDIIVHDERVYARVISDGSLGLGEAYVEGWWDSTALDETLTRICGRDWPTRLGSVGRRRRACS